MTIDSHLLFLTFSSLGYNCFFVIDDIEERVDVIMMRGMCVIGILSTNIFQEEEHIINSADSVCLFSLDWLNVGGGS